MRNDHIKLSRRLFLAGGMAAAGSLFIGHRPALSKSVASADASALGNVQALQKVFKGQVFSRGETGFNEAVYGELWNKRQAKRSPLIVARVDNEDDVVEAVKWAKDNNLKVVVRGGGHNWCSPSLRNGGMLIDLTNLNQIISIDAQARLAVVQPIVSNRELQEALNAKGMSFPSGHCPQVKMSGYLLSGGMAWNQGVWGPGVGSVEAIEMVTASGDKILANKDQYSDYFWASRGAGCGTFAVATRYHLKLYPLPKAIHWTSAFYSLCDVATVGAWLEKTAPTLPPSVELSLFVITAPKELAGQCKNQNGKVAMVTATIFADTAEEAKAGLKNLDTCPIENRCLKKSAPEPCSFSQLFDASGDLWPTDQRAHVEALFSNSKIADLFTALREHVKATPSPATVFMFAIFTGQNVPAPLIDAAFSMSAKLYGGPWTMWSDARDDEVNDTWHKECLNQLKPFTVGHYISETDTVAYPEHARQSFTAQNWERLKHLRQKHDPQGLFFNYQEALA